MEYYSFTVSLARVMLLLLLVDYSYNQNTRNLEYDTEEEKGAGVLVGNTARDSGLYTEFGNDFRLLIFEPFKQGNEYIQYFFVDVSSGVIRTAKNIDREEICTKDPKCSVKLDIAVYKQSATSDSTVLQRVLQVTINILDVNDQSPTFPRRVVNLPVPENLEINHPLYTSVATDADAEGVNSRITYRLEPSSDVFELSTVKTADGLEDLVITVKKVLDREVKKLYPLMVVATDLGNSPKSGSVLINVQVTDMNDNSPVFGQLNYTVNIPENSDISAPVVIVSASDDDEGENAKLTYVLSNQVSQKIRDTFLVEPETGKIFSRMKLDFESEEIYQFYVSVSDNGSPSKSNFAYVTVKVIDVNDNAPVIDVTPAPGGDTITENGSVGKFLAHIRVSDADSGVNGEVSCRIEDSHFILEAFDNRVYKIKLNKELDREEAPKRDVVIICKDGDLMPMSASASFAVTVGDLNDNKPSFEKSSLYGSVMENGNDNAYVMKIVATDPDEGRNAEVTYAIASGEDMSLFSINAATGVISTTRMLDREVKKEYFLEVRATDRGLQPLSAFQTAVINVLDENDNPPKFTKQAFFNSIVENRQAGSPAGDVSAYDSDSAENARFIFSIMDTGPGAGDGMYFMIDPDSGVLRSDVPFDREQKDQYQFRVKVSDPSVSNYYDIANVTVTIEDDNDHAPVIVKPPPEDRTFRIPFNMSLSQVIMTFKATDEDDPNLVEMSYQIEGVKTSKRQKSPLFKMDSTTGKLRISRQIRPEDVDTHELKIVVRDGPRPTSRSSETTVSIIVEEGSEEAMRAFQTDSKTNMVIVIIIVAATIVLAFVVIAVICLIRRVDKKRHPQPPPPQGENNKLYQAAQWVSTHSVSNDVGHEMKSTLEVPNEKKKKKEVSFSLDDEVVESPDTSGSLGSVFSPSPNTTQKGDGVTYKMQNTEPGGFIVLNGLVTPDYSQHLYDGRSTSTDAPDERQYREVNRQAEDRYSDASSGDTGTSDSGRGGSEDEGHGHTSSSGDGDLRKHKPGNKLKNNDDTNQRYPVQQQLSPIESEEIPGSPTPMLSESEKHNTPQHCYIRRSFDQLPTHGLGYPSGASTRSSPSPSLNSQPQLYHSQPRHNSARLTLSNNDVEGPYRVKKAEQHQQLLKTFSSPFASGVTHNSTHPAWRRAKGLDTSWRSNGSSYPDDDDNTTTSGSYTINPDDLPDESYNPDVMV